MLSGNILFVGLSKVHMDAVYIGIGQQRPEENDPGEQLLSIVKSPSSVSHFGGNTKLRCGRDFFVVL